MIFLNKRYGNLAHTDEKFIIIFLNQKWYKKILQIPPLDIFLNQIPFIYNKNPAITVLYAHSHVVISNKIFHH